MRLESLDEMPRRNASACLCVIGRSRAIGKNTLQLQKFIDVNTDNWSWQ